MNLSIVPSYGGFTINDLSLFDQRCYDNMPWASINTCEDFHWCVTVTISRAVVVAQVVELTKLDTVGRRAFFLFRSISGASINRSLVEVIAY